MRCRLALILSLLTFPAVAQCIGAGDPAPSQAVAAGYTCKTFHWGAGDTISEIDTTGTAVPGKKLYYNPVELGGYSPVIPGQLTVVSGGPNDGQIISQPSDGLAPGPWFVNTCGGPASVGGVNTTWTVGQFFQHGWYVQFKGEWNTTAAPDHQAGFFGYDGYWYHDGNHGGSGGGCPGATFNGCYETDVPDAGAFGQRAAVHAGGTTFENNNSVDYTVIPSGTIDTGNKWGMLSTTTATTYYVNDTLNGHGLYDQAPGNTSVGALEMYNSKQCFGTEAISGYQLKTDTIDVWQVGGSPPSTFGGGRGLRR